MLNKPEQTRVRKRILKIIEAVSAYKQLHRAYDAEYCYVVVILQKISIKALLSIK